VITLYQSYILGGLPFLLIRYLIDVFLVFIIYFYVLPYRDETFPIKIETLFGQSYVNVGITLGILWPIILPIVLISLLFP